LKELLNFANEGEYCIIRKGFGRGNLGSCQIVQDDVKACLGLSSTGGSAMTIRNRFHVPPELSLGKDSGVIDRGLDSSALDVGLQIQVLN